MKDSKKEKERHEKYEKVKKEVTEGDEMLKALKTVSVDCPKHKKRCEFEKCTNEYDSKTCSWCEKNLTTIMYQGYDDLFKFKCTQKEMVHHEATAYGAEVDEEEECKFLLCWRCVVMGNVTKKPIIDPKGISLPFHKEKFKLLLDG